MTAPLLSRCVAALAALLVACPAAYAQAPAAPAEKFEPHVGQAGKDVIWVPTPDEVVERMLRMAQVTAKDLVIDLGSGDGKITIAAARLFGARAMGVEYNPDMVKLSQRNAQAAGVAGKATFAHGDIFQTDFSKATVLTMYLLPGLNLKLRPTILSMRPGTRVASHSFNMDDWEPDEVSSIDGRSAYLWIVPATVAGTWALDLQGAAPRKLPMSLDQRYQKVTGSVTLGMMQAGLREPQLTGSQIRFALVDDKSVRRDFTGTVTGARMEGSYRADNGTEGRWSAAKR
ncbi:MAG TPA: class I SAM-dependent methyltransferase [Burkholderiales bacterium]